MILRWFGTLILLVALVGAAPITGMLGATPIIAPVAAQAGGALDQVNDTANSTAGLDPTSSSHPALHVTAYMPEAFVGLDELSAARVPIVIQDLSIEGAFAAQTTTAVSCKITNQTENERSWSIQVTPPSTRVARGDVKELSVSVAAGVRASPEFVSREITCEADFPYPTGTREIARFNVTAHVLPYYRMALESAGVPDRMRPDQEFRHPMRLTNNGNQRTVFQGSVTGPPGWELHVPTTLTLDPGETKTFNVTGLTSRGPLWVPSESGMIQVRYAPADSPDRFQVQPIPVQLSGIYLHPALLPLLFVAVIILAALVFLAVLARRTVEEKILGKPVPPWRIPVEREYLQELMKNDADQYYIVRYYLMVEEHRSALLWFEAFKKATKKDRKRESAWFKIKRKKERKVVRLEKAHNKLITAGEKDVERPVRKAERKKRGLERKLRRKERKAHRKLERKHKKAFKKASRKHRKRVKRGTKRFEKKRDRQLRKVEKANKKREKKGEEPLPLPDLEPPTFEEPLLEQAQPLVEVPLSESRYAKRAERFDARAARRKERIQQKQQVRVAKDRRKVDRKVARLRAKIPPEPKTTLYAVDQYVPEDEVVVEDDRPWWAQWLALPTLEERERARRRNQVYRARIKEAQGAGDEQRAERLKAEMVQARKDRIAARAEDRAAKRGSRLEDAALAKERKRAVKARAQELVREADDGSTVETPGGPHPVRGPSSSDGEERATPSRFAARFRKGKSAATEDDADVEQTAPQKGTE